MISYGTKKRQLKDIKKSINAYFYTYVFIRSAIDWSLKKESEFDWQ